jgi:hypothetical protein
VLRPSAAAGALSPFFFAALLDSMGFVVMFNLQCGSG